MNRGKLELGVGAVIIAALLVGVGGTLWLQGTNWGRGETPVEVLLRDVAQLSAGNAVKFRGVQIGQVTQIRVEPTGEAVRVHLRLDGDSVVIPPEAAVLLAPESFFGDWQAEIVTRESYPAFDFFTVPASELTRDTVVLGGYALPEMSRLTASAQEISDNVAELSSRLEVAFNDTTAANMSQAVANIEQLTTDLRSFVESQSRSASDLSGTAAAALREIQAASQSARQSFARVEGILTDSQLDSLVTHVTEASRSLKEIAGAMEGSSDELASTLVHADSTFQRLDQITARLAAGEGAVGRLLTDSTLAVRAENVLLSLDLLLQDFRANPRRYVRLSIF